VSSEGLSALWIVVVDVVVVVVVVLTLDQQASLLS
jgi:hypothetical protein